MRYRNSRNPQAQPGRRGLRGDADDPARRPGRDHRQRRPHGRGRVPHRDAAAPPSAPRRLPGAGVRQERKRQRELTDRLRPLTERREQLRLPGPVRRPHRLRSYGSGFARVDINKHVNGCELVWTNHTESAPSVGTKALHDNLVWTVKSGRNWTTYPVEKWTTLRGARCGVRIPARPLNSASVAQHSRRRQRPTLDVPRLRRLTLRSAPVRARRAPDMRPELGKTVRQMRGGCFQRAVASGRLGSRSAWACPVTIVCVTRLRAVGKASVSGTPGVTRLV
jgi:hypothetical protein